MSEETTTATAETTEDLDRPTSIHDLKRKTKVKGTVERLELYGAFIDIGLEQNALVHISKLGKGHVNRVSDVLDEGEEVEVWVDKVDPEQGQIVVTMMEPLAVEWSDLKEGQVYNGTVKRLENFGAFVDIGAEREGLVHISEMSHDYVNHPSEVVSGGDEVQVQVLGFNRRKRRIDLSMKALLNKTDDVSRATTEDYDFEEEDEPAATAMEIAMRRAMGDSASEARKAAKKKRKKQAHNEQDDILSRTLNLGQEE